MTTELLNFAEASALIAGNPPRATVARWAAVGVRQGEDRIRLRSTCVDGLRFTTRAWIDAFNAALAGLAVAQ